MVQIGHGCASEITIDGIEKSLVKKITENPDIVELLEQKNNRLNTIKIEKKIQDILYAYGYFDSFIQLSFLPNQESFSAYIESGEQYHVGHLEFDQPSSLFIPYYLAQIRKGDLFNAFKLKEAEDNILEFLYGQECRYIKRVKHIVKPDSNTKTVGVIFDITVSPISVFGKSEFIGHKAIDNDVLDRLLTYNSGECYNEQKINNTVKNAINTNLFKNIYYEIDPHKKNSDGIAKIDINYTVEERKHRTYNYGIGISDTEALIVTGGNQWRNLFNKGVNLDIQSRLSNRAQTLDFDSVYPSYFGFRENLKASLEIGRLRLIQYDADTISSYIGYEREPGNGKRFTYGFGIRNNLSDVSRSAIMEEQYFITALPSFIQYNSKDNILRPTKGNLFSFSISPAVDLFNETNFFVRNQLTATHFMNLGTIGDPKLNSPSILALRTTAGSIVGSDLNDLPIIERFYSGGGGSIRGYEFQGLGELENGQTRGGVSLFESSIETRIGIGQTYGLVFFLDAGNVYPNIMPKMNKLQFAAGIGGRFYSDIIPIRFDIGVPLNPRSGRNDNFGFYIGIGESF